MLRSSASLLALCVAAFTLPAAAADYGMGDTSGYDNALRGALGADPGEWTGYQDDMDSLHFEMGARYWYSLGSTSSDTVYGVPTQETDTTQLGELHLRIEDHNTSTFGKALVGYSFKSTGSYSSYSSGGPINDGAVSYLGADFGWNPIASSDGSGAGFLVGYQYWNEGLDTGRYNFYPVKQASDVTWDKATGETFLPGDSAPNYMVANLLRLGVQGKAVFGPFDISAEAVAVPYAKISGVIGQNQEYYDFSVYPGGNIRWARASETAIDGWGYGGMGEVWIGIKPKDNMTFRVGGRAWYLQGTTDSTFDGVTVTNPSDDPKVDPKYDTAPLVGLEHYIQTNNPFHMFRYGILGELTYAF